jgi:AbiV family abortive infection protein
MSDGQDMGLYPMNESDKLKGIQLILKSVKKRLDSTKLLLGSDNPYDAFILYSFSYEEFGKALKIRDRLKKKGGLPKGLFTGYSAHAEKMACARDYLPSKCSHFTPWVKLSHTSDKTETVNYEVWLDKNVQTGTITRSAGMTGSFADSTVPSTFDDITREEFLYVNWDPGREKWHTNADYSIDELKEAIILLERNIIEFANQSDIRLG